MIAALAAGYRAVGAGKGDVPIHVNTNPSFWDHMRKKHNGIFGDAAMASDAEWEETKHPRGKGGKFAETAGGETGGGATPEAPKQPAFMKLHKGGATPEAAHKKTVEHVLNEKTKTGANYRGLIKHLINEAPKHGNGEAVNHLKAKLGHSYEVASEKLIDLASKSKDYDEQKQLIAMAEKAKKQAKKYGFETAPMPAIAPAPKAAAPAPAPPKPEPAPAPKPAAAKAPQASPADLEKAKKPTSFPTGSATSLEGKKIIEAFNAKYGGKTITDPEALNQKVADFKGMQAFVAQENVKAKEAAVQAQAQKEKKAKELAAKQAEEYAKQFSTPEAKAHYEVLAAIAGGGKSAKAYFEHAQTKIKNAGLEGKIDAPSAAMIIAYTGSSFREVNSQLRQGIMTPEQYKYTKALNGALDKLPPYVGTCYRKADVPKATAANFKPGFIVPERAFTSSSKNEDIWSGDYHYVIESKGGRDVQKLSSHGGEAEVLFKANTHFMVTKVDGNKIHMTEVD